jgi:outer membrane lipoprotein carrier protein
MRFELSCLLALVLLSFELTSPASGSRPSDSACGEAAAAALQRRYESVRDLRAEIVQTTRSASLGTGPSHSIVSSGTVTLAKPGKLRWSYEQPEPSLVVSDGATLWIYDPQFQEVQKLPATEGYLSGAAIQFLLGEGDMGRDFEISALACGEDSAELLLVPRTPASYEKLHVVVNPGTGDLKKTTVFFVLGNVTEVEFSDIQINLDPPPETFRLEPPPGVRVIELEPSPQ